MTWIHTSKGSIIKSKKMKHIILAFCHIIFLLAGKGVLGEVCPAESENGATLGELGPIADASTFVSLAQTLKTHHPFSSIKGKDHYKLLN